MTTLLVIDGADLTPYCNRGITQSLQPIGAAAAIRRTVNGDLVNLGLETFQKFQSVVSCTDQAVPALDSVWPGKAVWVSCLAELSYLTAGGQPSRSVVAGSSRIEGAFTFYRPLLQMLVTAHNVTQNEYGASVAWQIALEEV